MALFLGNYANKVDRKGRVSVPAQFRSALAGQVFNGIVAFPSFKEPMIEAFSLDHMQQMAESVQNYDQFSEDRDDLATLFADSLQIPFDGEGRIVLPQSLVSHAGIGETALFVSAIDHFQIWEPEAYARKKAAARERLASRNATVKVLPRTALGGNGAGGASPLGER